jgi:hypothetical protein
MKHLRHKINGFSVMMLSAIGISLVITTHIVGAQTTTKTVVQPKVSSIKVVLKSSDAQKTQILTWPRDAGKITELDPGVTQIQINPLLQQGYNQKTYWAFRYVWSDEAPTMESFMTDSKTIANRFFKSTSFGTKASSPMLQVNAMQNHNKYVTIYAFVTNKDREVGARNFPFGIDYVAAATYHVPEKSITTTEPAQKENIIVPEKNEWADPKSGYQE